MVKDNQDYYKRGGRSGGPAGPRSQQKQKLTKERAILQRDEERKLPGEKPLSGKKGSTQAFTATEEAEAQLASLHAEKRSSVLDRLPKPVGAAGVPRSAKPTPSPTSGVAFESEGIEPGETGTWNLEPREEEAPFNFGIPASEDAALGHKREPFERENREMQKAAREIDRARAQRELSPMVRRVVERFPQVFRMVGDAASAVDRPLKRAIETLQWLGSAASTRKAT